MDNDAPDHLEQESSNQQTTWETGPIMISVASSLEDDSPKEINFSSTIGCNTPLKLDVRLYLQSCYNKNDKEARLAISDFFNKACATAGVQIRMKGWEHGRQCLRFFCVRSRKYQSRRPAESTGKKRYNSSTKKPLGSEHTCKFGFSVHWDEWQSRWYIQKFGGGCRMHTGHCRNGTIIRRPTRSPEPIISGGPIQEIKTSQRDEDEGGLGSYANEEGGGGQSEELQTPHPGTDLYTAFLPLFQDITRTGTMEEDFDHIQKTLLDLRDYVHRKKRSRPEQPHTAKATSHKRRKPAPISNTRTSNS